MSRSHEEETGARGSGRVGVPTFPMEIIAMSTTETVTAAAITTSKCAAIFVSLELSRSTWLMTALAAPLGSKMSRHQVRGGDVPDLLKRFSDLQRAVQHRTGQTVPVIVIQEAGLDGFWIHRALIAAGKSRAMWSTRPRSRSRDGTAGPRRTGSTVKPSSALSWPGGAASLGFAPWCACRRRRRKIAAGFAGN